MTLFQRRIPQLGSVCLLLTLTAACSGSDNTTPTTTTPPSNTGTPSAATTALNVALSPAEEVPALSGLNASGTATLSLNPTNGELSGSVSVQNLSGPASMAHIHTGFAGSNGGVLIALEGNADGSQWGVPANTVLDTVQLDALNNGGLYINVHTAAYPAGEVRGQIIPSQVQLIRTTLSGDQEVPAVATVASAQAVITVNNTSGAIWGSVVTNGLEDATMAHIHQAPAGQNGPVAVGLEQDADNVALWRLPAGATLNSEQRGALANGGLYYNVHTPANPGGEVRGQIVPEGVSIGSSVFTVRVENVSSNTTLPTSIGSVAVPLSPGVYVIHRDNLSPLLEPRNPASAALEALAEDGNPALFTQTLDGAAVFNTPVGASEPGPILPGGAYEFSFSASPGDKLSLATMFVHSNDWFYTSTDEDDSISLFDANGQAVTGDVTNQVALWESGTEVDEEPGTGINQAPRQATPNTGTAEQAGVGSLASKGKSVTLNGPVIRVTLSAN